MFRSLLIAPPIWPILSLRALRYGNGAGSVNGPIRHERGAARPARLARPDDLRAREGDERQHPLLLAAGGEPRLPRGQAAYRGRARYGLARVHRAPPPHDV